MGMRGGQDQRPEVREVEPEGELAPKHAAGFSRPSSGYDLDTAHPVGARRLKEMHERMEAALGGAAVEIQTPCRRELAGTESLPSGVIHTRRLQANRDR